MLKRILCVLLLLCMLVQAFPLTVLADMLDGEQTTADFGEIIPEAFAIKGLDTQTGSVSILSPEARTALLIAAQYKDGAVTCVNAVEAALVIGRNVVAIPDFQADETATVKIMLWDSIEGMRPLCDSLEMVPAAFEVRFDTGSTNLEINSRRYASNARFGILPKPYADGYLFVGWYYDAEFANPVAEDDLVTGSCTLYAKMLDLAALYGDVNTAFAEHYVANTEASGNTKVLILSDDTTMSAEEVLKGITAENLSVLDETENYKVERYALSGLGDAERAALVAACEAQQSGWLDDADADTVFFVFSAENGFAEGNSYRITLNDGRLSFAGYAATARDYNMSVEKTEMSNLTLRGDIIFVDETLVNDYTDGGDPEATLSGVSVGGSQSKTSKRFSLGKEGDAFKLSAGLGGKLEITPGTGDTASGTITISGDKDAVPEALNDKTVAVYGTNEQASAQSAEGRMASLFGSSLIPDKLTLDNSELWNMEYRTIEGQTDGDYIYTDTEAKDVLFKPDVFPYVGIRGEATDEAPKKVTIDEKLFDPEKPVAGLDTEKTYKYEDFGITEDTTIDVGDFIAFLQKNENEERVPCYAKITDIAENNGKYILTYVNAAEEDILDSMDMYGKRDLRTKELTGLEDFSAIEEEAELQAVNSGFADRAAMYVSSVMVASEAFANLSKEYELNFEEIRRELTDAADAADAGGLVLFGDSGKNYIYKSKNGALTVNKPTVNATADAAFEENGTKFGLKLDLEISGTITIEFGKNPKNTITISYKVKFTQTLRAEISVCAEASIHYVLWIIPVIDDCIINVNLNFYTASDADLSITAGLTSDSVKDLVWYAPTSGEKYHLDECSHKTDYIKFVSIEDARTLVNNGTLLTPCERCKPEESDADRVWYAPKSGTKYHLEECTYKHDNIKYVPIEEARKIVKNGKKLLPCEDCKPEEKVYVTPYGECYHRKNCSYLAQSKANGTLVACDLQVAKEEAKYRPCSVCCPDVVFENQITGELKGLLDKVDSFHKEITEAAGKLTDFKNMLEEARKKLGGEEPEQADDAGAATGAEQTPAALLAEKELVDRYQALLSNAYSDWTEIYRLNLFSANVFSFWGIVNVTVAMDFCVYANLNLALDANVHYENSKQYIFTIYTFKGEIKQSVQDLVPEQLSLNFTAMGTAGLKMGVELAIGVNFINDKIGRVAVTGEIGLYIKMWGYFKYTYTNIRPPDGEPITENSCHGALYLEVGPYLEVGLSASLLNGRKSWNPTLYYKEYPIIKVGERETVFGFADDRNDAQLRLRKECDTIALPKDILSVAYLDLRTGKTGTKAYLDDLKTAKQIDASTFVSKYYTIVVNNDGGDEAFRFNPRTASIIVEPDGEPEEAAELIITYNRPATAFNRAAITKTVHLYWDSYGDARTILFDTNGGDYIAPLIEYAGKKIALPTPVRPGYIFAGWMNGTEAVGRLDTMPDADMTLTAAWTPGKTQYTVNHWQYDLQGVPQLVETQTVEDVTTESVVNPSPKQYTGFVTPAVINAVAEGDGSTEINYYYKRKTYVYELQVKDQTTRRMVRYGEPIVLTGREVAGYDFDGWYVGDADGNISDTSIFALLDREPTEGVLMFNYEFDYDLTLCAKLVAHTDTPYLIEFYTRQVKDFTTGSGDTNLIYTEKLGELRCEGVTDTEVNLNDILPKNFELVEIQKKYGGTDTEQDETKSGFKFVAFGFNPEEWDYDPRFGSDLEEKITIKGDGTLVLRLYYEKAKRTVNYEYEGFSRSLNAFVNQLIPLPDKNPGRIGYTFGGWEYKANDIVKYRAKYMADQNPAWAFCDKDGKLLRDEDGNLLPSIPMPRVPYDTEAIWKANTYTIKLYAPETKFVSEESAHYGEKLPKLPQDKLPTRAGYTFTGYSDKDGKQYYNAQGDAVDENGKPFVYNVAKDVELYAKWEAIEYNLFYKLGDNNSAAKAVNPNTANMYTAESNVDFKDPTRKGYKFEGWYTTETFDEGTQITSTKGIVGELTIYAKWDGPIARHIGYDLNQVSGAKAENHPNNLDEYTVETKALTLYAPSRLGYTFSGWTSSIVGLVVAEQKDDSGNAEWIVTNLPESGEIEFIANWKANTYDIQYDTNTPKNATNGVSFAGKPTTCMYDTELKVAAPTLKGWKFTGWTITGMDDTTHNIGGKQINETSCEEVKETTFKNLRATAGEVTFTAQWTPVEYTVKYNTNKPENAPPEIDFYVDDVSAWMYDDTLKPLPMPTLRGWQCEGWYKRTDDSFVGKCGTKVKNLSDKDNDVVELYAKWTPNKYYVYYDRNGATTETMKQSMFTCDQEGILSLNQYRRVGYTFKGWSRKSDANSADYADGATVKNLTFEQEKIVTLYAVWEANNYTVTFRTNGGEDKTSISYTINDVPTSFAAIKYKTYPEYNHFLGWYADAALTQPFVNDLKAQPRNVTLYAKWDLCTVYNSIDSTPWGLSGRVILDWRNESDTNLLNHKTRNVLSNRYNNVDIYNSAKEIIFIGTTAKTFTNFRMYICQFAKGQKLTIRFVNFKFVTNENAAIGLYEDKGVDLTIDVVGTCSIGTSCAGGNIVNLSQENTALTVTGTGRMTMTAGNGANAAQAGQNGGNGGIGIIANKISSQGLSGSLTVCGGNGGNAKDGTTGTAGKNGLDGEADWDKGRNGGPGKKGEKGGNGGNGGNGAVAILISENSVLTNKVTIVNGDAGSGGNGGRGGTGGRGGNGGRRNGNGILILDTSRWKGLNGGKGGDGGDGGSAGTNGEVAAKPLNVSGDYIYVAGKKSNRQLEPGIGGSGGAGGEAGYIYNHSWDHGKFYGSAGAPGNSGKRG